MSKINLATIYTAQSNSLRKKIEKGCLVYVDCDEFRKVNLLYENT
jgi:hypothetical protein